MNHIIGKSEFYKYFSLFILLIIIVLSGLIISPFIIPIITAFLLSHLFNPLYVKIKNKIKRDWIASLLIAVIIILGVFIPSLVVINTLSTQAIDVYDDSNDYLDKNNQTLSDYYNTIESKLGIKLDIGQILESVKEFIVKKGGAIVSGAPKKILNFLVMLFLLFYILKDGKNIEEKFIKVVPVNEKAKKKIVTGLKTLIGAVVYGSLMTAAIQGTLGAIGFKIFGISQPIFWGFMMAFFALIPFFGTTIIWIPAAIFLIAKGILLNELVVLVKGIGLFIYGTFVISLVDNIIKPKLIGERGKLHPAIVLLGILGGISLFGLIGIILGPMILAVFLAIVKVYSDEYGI